MKILGVSMLRNFTNLHSALPPLQPFPPICSNPLPLLPLSYLPITAHFLLYPAPSCSIRLLPSASPATRTFLPPSPSPPASAHLPLPFHPMHSPPHNSSYPAPHSTPLCLRPAPSVALATHLPPPPATTPHVASPPLPPFYAHQFTLPL